MTTYPATLLCDFYKVSHKAQYPQDTSKIYSTWTPRTSRIPGIDKVVAFGFQAFLKEYVEYFNVHFFGRPRRIVVDEYRRIIKYTLGIADPDVSHIEALHDLGYLPLRIKAVKEGTLVPIRTPMLTVENTLPEFFWLTNYIETLMSLSLWKASTNATLALEYRRILDKYADITGGPKEAVQFQGHDFSMRGMDRVEAAAVSGAGHLLSFVGTDVISAISFLEKYYDANVETELVGTSIPATEHSVMCAYGTDELASYRRIITEVYPSGFVSIVSDTWDLWKVLSDVIAPLKNTIMARDGKVVIRPDSGDPVDIICGSGVIEDLTNNEYCEDLEGCKAWMEDGLADKVNSETPHGECGDSELTAIFKFQGKYYEITVEFEWNRYDKQYYYEDGHRIKSCVETTLSPSQKGVIEILWEIFGGTVNAKGFKELDSHIGAIYGDAITLERCTAICERLAAKGFASTNMVYGIGSYTYQYNTRDTFGFALKSTYANIGGEEKFLFKDPVTDTDKVKKSQTGMVVVSKANGPIEFTDGLTEVVRDIMSPIDMLEDIFVDGVLLREQSLSEIRGILRGEAI